MCKLEMKSWDGQSGLALSSETLHKLTLSLEVKADLGRSGFSSIRCEQRVGCGRSEY